VKIMNGLDLSNQKVTNLGDPSANTDGANKQYVDNIARGVQWKAPVRAATTGTGTLATAFANGQSVDGVTLITGDRILIKDQASGAENGIYTVSASGVPTRAVDADTNGELAPGTTTLVTEGTANGDKSFAITSNAAITIGITASTWGQIGGGTTYTASNGVLLTGANFTAVAGTGITVGAGGIAIDTGAVARKYSANIGTGSSTSIVVTHGLGTKDVTVSLRQNSDDAGFLTDWVATDVNSVTLTFATAPTSNQHRVTVTG
jgi:hypothetical protein